MTGVSLSTPGCRLFPRRDRLRRVSDIDDRDRSLPATDPDSDEPYAESETLLAILSGVQRKGEWEPAEVVRVYAVMGGAELDFCDAVLLEGVTEVSVFAVMGGADIKVPRDVNVEVRGMGIMGGFKHLDHRAEDDDAPTLRITGYAIMGGVDVKMKKERRWFRRR